jgi:hypothetical protein
MPSKGKISSDAVTQKQQKNLALPVTSLATAPTSPRLR